MNTNSIQQPDDQAAMAAIVDIRHISTAAACAARHAADRLCEAGGGQRRAGFAIHAADGTPMAIAGDLDVAVAAIVQHEMVPAQVH